MVVGSEVSLGMHVSVTADIRFTTWVYTQKTSKISNCIALIAVLPLTTVRGQCSL